MWNVEAEPARFAQNRKEKMPYYIGAGEPEWDNYIELLEEDSERPLRTLLKYIEPWEAKTMAVSFPATPGPEPVVPPELPYPYAPIESRERKPGLIARLFGKKKHAGGSTTADFSRGILGKLAAKAVGSLRP
jgi:hypothetical protein